VDQAAVETRRRVITVGAVDEFRGDNSSVTVLVVEHVDAYYDETGDARRGGRRLRGVVRGLRGPRDVIVRN
jgi:hypothetical protein